MTRRLVAIGNSQGLIFDRKTLARAGLAKSSAVDVTVEEGRIVIEPAAPDDPIERLRRRFDGVDAVLLDAVINIAAKQARSETSRIMKQRRGP